MKKITINLISWLNVNAWVSEVDGENYSIRLALIWKQKTLEVYYMYGNIVIKPFAHMDSNAASSLLGGQTLPQTFAQSVCALIIQ